MADEERKSLEGQSKITIQRRGQMKNEEKAEYEEMEEKAMELLRIEITAPFGKMTQKEADLISEPKD